MFNTFPNNFMKEKPEIAFIAGAVTVAATRMINQLTPMFNNSYACMNVDIFEIEDENNIQNSIKRRMLNNLYEFSSYGESDNLIIEKVNSTNLEFVENNLDLCDSILSLCPIEEKDNEKTKAVIHEFIKDIDDYIKDYYCYISDNDFQDISYSITNGIEILEKYYYIIYACNIVVYDNICFLILLGTTE